MKKLYQVSPVWMQQLGINAYGWYWKKRRLGQEFETVWRAYAERESWSADRLREYVEAQLRQQLQRAFSQVPYYQRVFRQCGLDAASLRNFTLEDLARLPVLEKSELRETPTICLTTSAARKPPMQLYTSGSTGTPITVFMDREMHQHTLGVREARSFRWAGVSLRESRATFGAKPIVPLSATQGPYWRYNVWEHQVYFSIYHIRADRVEDYAAALNRYQPTTIVGFPSALGTLAHFFAEKGIAVYRPRAIIMTSEPLDMHTREKIEQVFGCRCYQEYSSVENCFLATECERGQLHVSVDFGYLEILRPDGSPCPRGEVGEIVATGFANKNQLFIRYRVGDYAAWSGTPCACGRSALPTLEGLIGRVEDVLLLPDGRSLFRADTIFKQLPGIQMGQIVQTALDTVEIKIVPAKEFDPSVEGELRRRFQELAGAGMKVAVTCVSEISRERSGKIRAVVNLVRRNGGLKRSE
ncbi:MAG: AMP-binding protein [Firmicutes bacterium]|nr:AMP-binding protein [Bacillota bacterium]